MPAIAPRSPIGEAECLPSAIRGLPRDYALRDMATALLNNALMRAAAAALMAVAISQHPRGLKFGNAAALNGLARYGELFITATSGHPRGRNAGARKRPFHQGPRLLTLRTFLALGWRRPGPVAECCGLA